MSLPQIPPKARKNSGSMGAPYFKNMELSDFAIVNDIDVIVVTKAELHNEFEDK